VSDFGWIVVAGGACLLGVAIYTRVFANAAQKSGEFWYTLHGFKRVTRRADDPQRFEWEIRLLRSMPWVIAGVAAIGAAVIVS
jgi:hypothetical protein